MNQTEGNSMTQAESDKIVVTEGYGYFDDLEHIIVHKGGGETWFNDLIPDIMFDHDCKFKITVEVFEVGEGRV